jgi:hypothetical protein
MTYDTMTGHPDVSLQIDFLQNVRLSRCHSAKRDIMLCVVLLVIATPYLRLTQAYFLGYDDFNEVRRAAFEDTEQPLRMFTTAHFRTAKYRPLNRGINLVTYHVGRGNPVAFRTRNILFHLLNASLLFYLGIYLFDSTFIAALGATLFGLHPLAHQAVAGAVMTNTAAASLALAAILLGLHSYRKLAHQWRWLIAAMTTLFMGILVYEADISAVGIILLYCALDQLFSRRRRMHRKWLLLAAPLAVGIIISMLGMRALVLSTRQPAASPLSIAKNATMYLIAVAAPVDSLLANQWLGTPLVSEMHLRGVGQRFGAITSCSLLLILALLVVFRRKIRNYLLSLRSLECVFLPAAALLALLPLLVFNDHASETYLYLPIAFCMLFLSRLFLDLWRAHSVTCVIVTIFLVASFGCATWARTERVVRSGNIARRILSELPCSNWSQGAWRIRLATAPGQSVSHRYGLYAYQGLDTIANADGIGAIQSAIELKTGNRQVNAQVLSPDKLREECSRHTSDREPCFWVYSSGRIEPFRSRSSPIQISEWLARSPISETTNMRMGK